MILLLQEENNDNDDGSAWMNERTKENKMSMDLKNGIRLPGGSF